MNIADVAVSLVKVIVVGLVLGAGLPAIFALGLRLSSTRTTTVVAASGAPGTSTASAATTATGAGGSQTVAVGPTTMQRVLGALCFAVVGLAVVAGIVWIVING